jgi:hypothetical protein
VVSVSRSVQQHPHAVSASARTCPVVRSSADHVGISGRRIEGPIQDHGIRGGQEH